MKKSAKTLHRKHDHVQAFIKTLQQLSHRHRLHTVFADFRELSAISLSNAVDRV